MFAYGHTTGYIVPIGDFVVAGGESCEREQACDQRGK